MNKTRKGLDSVTETSDSSENLDARALRDVREEMITDDDYGPLYIDEKYKKQGYHRRIVDASRGGRVERLLRMGYAIVQDDMKVGRGSVNSVGSLDSAVRVYLGGTKEPMGVLMEIPDELYQRRAQMKAKKAEEVLQTVGKTGIPTQSGEIIIGDKRYS